MHDPKTCEHCQQRTDHKVTFGPGPWQDEPDRVDFEHSGLPCFLNRNHHGVWCGYAGVPNGHPMYGVEYGEVDVEVHGDLTYSDRCDGCLCHTPKPGETDDVWWLGFDCGHSGDYSPGRMAFFKELKLRIPSHGTYRDVDYVRRETESLAEQLSAAGKEKQCPPV